MTAEQRWIDSCDAVAAGHPGWVMNLFEGYPTWLTIPGPPHVWQRMVPTGRGKGLWKRDAAAQQAIAWQLRCQYRGEPLEGVVGLYVRFWVADNRTRDSDNMLKALKDAARRILFADDRQVRGEIVLVDVDRENPRTELAVGRRKA